MTLPAPGMTIVESADLRYFLQQMLESLLGDLGTEDPPPALRLFPYSASISITGQYDAEVSLICTAALTEAITATFLGVDVAAVTEADKQDTVKEMANIIGGSVKSLVPQPSVLSLPRFGLYPAKYSHASVAGECRWHGEEIVARLHHRPV